MYIDTKKMRYYTLTIEQPIAQERNGLNEKEIQGGFFYEEKSITIDKLKTLDAERFNDWYIDGREVGNELEKEQEME